MARGITSVAGRQGGTFAHRDIAFEFGSGLVGPESELCPITQLRRLKGDEGRRLLRAWDPTRTLLSRLTCTMLSATIREKLVPPSATPDRAVSIDGIGGIGPRVPSPVRTFNRSLRSSVLWFMEPSPPPGYDEIGAITITLGRSILVQALSLLLALATLAVLLAAAGAGSFTIGLTELVLLLVVIAGTIGVLFLHEAIHGLVFALSGLRPRFDAAIVHGMPVLSTSAVGPYGRNTALICLLAPLVLIDAVLLGVSAAVPTFFVWVIAPIVINTAGSTGDLWLAARLVRYGPAVLVADIPDGLVVYGRSDERRAAGR